MLNDRTLRNWRKAALEDLAAPKQYATMGEAHAHVERQAKQILKLTQELLDLNLLRR